MINSAVGNIETIGDQQFISTKHGDSGWALYGPYEKFEPGRYGVCFSIKIPETDHSAVPDNTICCTVDVALAGGEILISQPIFASMIKADATPIILEFELDQPTHLEFRVFATGAAPLLTACERKVVVNPTTRQWSTPSGNQEEEAFFTENFSHFNDLRLKGAEITRTAEGAIVKFQGVRLRIKKREEWQVIQEILIYNDYNFNTRRDVCVIDVGMNIGLASLHFAGKSSVQKVYSFEPFEAPFRRALDNFSLNADLQAKLNPRNFGLGGKTEELSVMYDEESSLSGSVRGRHEGQPTTIAIRNASEVFREILAEARANDWDVVAKVDCEGSEFPIFDVLDNDGLLPQVRIFMIEWHKWWSAEKTQHDLMEKLIRNGFDVFDRTNPFDPFAGTLYAVRAAS